MKRPDITDERLRELRERGLSFRQIAAETAMSADAVHYRLMVRPFLIRKPRTRKPHDQNHRENSLLHRNGDYYYLHCANERCKATSPLTINQGATFDAAEAIGWRLFGGRHYCPRHPDLS